MFNPRRAYQQVIDNMAYHLSLMLFEDEYGIFLYGRNHEKYGDDVRTLDNIARVTAETFGGSEDYLYDKVMKQVDDRLAFLYLHAALTGEILK